VFPVEELGSSSCHRWTSLLLTQGAEVNDGSAAKYHTIPPFTHIIKDDVFRAEISFVFSFGKQHSPSQPQGRASALGT